MSLKNLVSVVETIYTATGGAPGGELNQIQADRFTILRREVSSELKQVREVSCLRFPFMVDAEFSPRILTLGMS